MCNADVGAVRPAGLDIRARKAPVPEPARAPAESESSSGDEGAGYRYRTIRDSLQALTVGVPRHACMTCPAPGSDMLSDYQWEPAAFYGGLGL